ncbi:MAG: class I SAM-dependent methyltransferase [Nanoarchaeota archaeon]
MDKSFEAKYHSLEKDHWWFVARRDMILKIFDIYKIPKTSEILDIGCSGGDLIEELNKEDYSNVFGIDISKDAIEICKEKNIPCSFMDAQKIKLKKKFDILIASDVLEHIKDRNAAAKNWKSLLKDGGLLICFCPAFNFLWSSHDEINHHYQRYDKKSFSRLFYDWKILKLSYWNFFLFVPITLVRFTQKLIKPNSKKANLAKTPKIINFLLTKLLFFENILLKYLNFPFGVSIFIVAQNHSKKD